MAIENALIAKIVGGLAAVCGVGSAGVVYKDDIFNWINGTVDKDYYFLVKSSAPTTAVEENKELTKNGVNNYKCKYDGKSYDCDIVSQIASDDNKKLFKLNEIKKTTIDKSKLKAADNYFLLKVKYDEKQVITFDKSKSFDIEEMGVTTAKSFGKLTPIIGKRENKEIGQFQYFVAKVNDFSKAEKTAGKFVIGADKTYKCGFFEKLSETLVAEKSCDIYKFSATPPAAVKEYKDLTFDGTTLDEQKKVKANDSISKDEHYIVKLTEEVESNIFTGKNLIYLQQDAETTKKYISFSPIHASTLITITSGTNNNNLIIIN